MSFAKLAGILSIGFAGVLIPSGSGAQSVSPYSDNLTIRQYLREAGGIAKYVAPGRLRLAGRRVLCGKRPSILDPEFDTWAGAYTKPGFIIVNPIYMRQEPKVVQLYIYAHECGHQFRGFDEDTADAFAIRRGVRQGWLKRRGMKQVCTFISRVPGDAEHPAGPVRCRRMMKVYKDIVVRHKKAVARKRKARRNKRSMVIGSR
ncbi:MAG: hypothetical protein L3J67_09405 [Hyphomicrobiaceae bacterium]|nr:hypothetical protein [Hyphomicrobiaceae bacterium]